MRNYTCDMCMPVPFRLPAGLGRGWACMCSAMGSLTPAVAWCSQRQRNWPQGNTSPSTLCPTTAQIGTTVLNTHINRTSHNAQYVWVSCISLLGVAVWHSVFIDWEILVVLHALWLYNRPHSVANDFLMRLAHQTGGRYHLCPDNADALIIGDFLSIDSDGDVSWFSEWKKG